MRIASAETEKKTKQIKLYELPLILGENEWKVSTWFQNENKKITTTTFQRKVKQQQQTIAAAAAVNAKKIKIKHYTLAKR